MNAKNLGGGYIKRLGYSTILILVVGVYFCLLHNTNKEINLKVKTEESILAIYLEDEAINYIPSRDSGYTLDIIKSSCTNGVTISFDYNTWTIKTNYINYENKENTRVKCTLYFTKKYIEPLLNGTDPVLQEPLIPVTISDDGVVKKADLASEWYDYETKKWANAVILFDETKNYTSNEIIPEEEIESYFVWIPKYRYQLWDLGLYDSLTTIDTSKVHEIPIIFGDYDTNDNVSGECNSPMESGASGNCEVGDYMTHPAFLSIPSTGFWAGKFSTGFLGSTNPTEAEQDIVDPSKIIVKSNVYSWRKINLANSHLNSYQYQRNLDSHMMKNTEWGAVAYLSHSAYGISASIRINNNSDHITGYAALNEPTCGYPGINEECNKYCNDNTCNIAYPKSNLASTTGNNTGFFDVSMQGILVFSVMADESGEPLAGSQYISGFNGKFTFPNAVGMEEYTIGIEYPDAKYYDLYLHESDIYNNSYKRRILGDATGEMGPLSSNHINIALRISSWYDDSISQYFSEIYPFAVRGYGATVGYGEMAGIFSFLGAYGSNDRQKTFRIVLTPT